jgi:hypothetical protein
MMDNGEVKAVVSVTVKAVSVTASVVAIDGVEKRSRFLKVISKCAKVSWISFPRATDFSG